MSLPNKQSSSSRLLFYFNSSSSDASKGKDYFFMADEVI